MSNTLRPGKANLAKKTTLLDRLLLVIIIAKFRRELLKILIHIYDDIVFALDRLSMLF